MNDSKVLGQLVPGRAFVAIYWTMFWLLNGLDKFFILSSGRKTGDAELKNV
jgi:hypothetical protein